MEQLFPSFLSSFRLHFTFHFFPPALNIWCFWCDHVFMPSSALLSLPHSYFFLRVFSILLFLTSTVPLYVVLLIFHLLFLPSFPLQSSMVFQFACFFFELWSLSNFYFPPQTLLYTSTFFPNSFFPFLSSSLSFFPSSVFPFAPSIFTLLHQFIMLIPSDISRVKIDEERCLFLFFSSCLFSSQSGSL